MFVLPDCALVIYFFRFDFMFECFLTKTHRPPKHFPDLILKEVRAPRKTCLFMFL